MQAISTQPTVQDYTLDVRRDRRRHQRVKVSLLGRYMLPDRREYPCQTIDMSPGGLALAAPKRPAIGEKIIVYLDGLGRVEGVATRQLEDGFAMELRVPLTKREKLADQLTWLANRAALGMPEDRRHERIEPKIRRTTLKMPDGQVHAVKIIDVSLSGTAVQTNAEPKMGDIVTVGETPCRVVRVFDGGVAMEFTRMLNEAHFDEDIQL